MKKSLNNSILKIKFVPKYKFIDTPLLLRDNSPNNSWLINKIKNDSQWKEVWGLVHIVVGYNPNKNGSHLIRGCGNSCPSCYFDENYLKTNPQHISAVQEVTPRNLNILLSNFIEEAQKQVEQRIERNVEDKDKRIRISGDVQGDPVMADYKTTKKIVSIIKEKFPNITLIIDTVANQYVMSPNEWKSLGADIIMVSINAVSTEEAYMTFHGVERGRFNIVQENIRNIDKSGVRVGLSYVWASHPRLDEEIRKRMPKYILDGQNEKARMEFIKNLYLKYKPLERFWYFSTGTEKVFNSIISANKRYERLLIENMKI